MIDNHLLIMYVIVSVLDPIVICVNCLNVLEVFIGTILNSCIDCLHWCCFYLLYLSTINDQNYAAIVILPSFLLTFIFILLIISITTNYLFTHLNIITLLYIYFYYYIFSYINFIKISYLKLIILFPTNFHILFFTPLSYIVLCCFIYQLLLNNVIFQQQGNTCVNFTRTDHCDSFYLCFSNYIFCLFTAWSPWTILQHNIAYTLPFISFNIYINSFQISKNYLYLDIFKYAANNNNCNTFK